MDEGIDMQRGEAALIESLVIGNSEQGTVSDHLSEDTVSCELKARVETKERQCGSAII